jgi:hypothetical protein
VITDAIIRHCRHLVSFLLRSNRCLYLAKVVNGFMDHELVQIAIYDIGVLSKDI